MKEDIVYVTCRVGNNWIEGSGLKEWESV